ncbi:MAG: histidine phosphatase family protein [Rhodospirillales bacterium]|nr:histidine phosphatase family protein [Rhodospirillales bacterium]
MTDRQQTKFGSFSPTAAEQPTVTRWWWVRHAPVIDGEGRLYGQEDLDCDISDFPRFQALARHLPKDAMWIVTNLSRTHKTAQGIRDAGISGPEFVIETDFAEQFFGDWQGLTWAEMESLNKTAYEEFWQNPSGNAPPKGESFADLIGRTAPAVEKLTARFTGRDIVCVAHGGSIRAAVAQALDLHHERGLSISIDTLSLTRIDHVEGGVLNGKGKVWRVGGINAVIR